MPVTSRPVGLISATALRTELVATEKISLPSSADAPPPNFVPFILAKLPKALFQDKYPKFSPEPLNLMYSTSVVLLAVCCNVTNPVVDSVPVIDAPVPVTYSTLATRSLLNVHAPAVVDFCVQSRPLPPLLANNKEASAPDFVNEPIPVTARPVEEIVAANAPLG